MSPPRTRRPTSALARVSLGASPGERRQDLATPDPRAYVPGGLTHGQHPFRRVGGTLYLGMDDVTLPPELERFAEAAVAAGRFRDVSAVVAAGVSLLQRQEQARAELLASVLAAEEEADRDGI